MKALLRLSLPLFLLPAVAAAQSEPFALDRYNPSERGSDWFANESLDLRGHVRPALGLVLDYGYRPLVLYYEDGDDLPIVEHQLYAHLGGGIVLWDRVRAAVNLPVLVYNDGETGTTTTTSFSSESTAGLGDLRLGLDVRLLGKYGGPITVAAGAQVFLPTGNQDAYASDGAVRLLPRLLAAGDVGPIAYAAQVGYYYRYHSGTLDGAPFGSELTFSAAVGPRLLDRKLIIGPELFGSTVVSEGGAAFDRRTTPFELIFGGKYQVTKSLRIGLGVGPGLTRGLGSPALRGLASIEWMPAIEEKAPAPPPAPSDRDGDGILDSDDACPDEKGVASDDPTKNGCPLPADRDGDTILDADDACPDEKGVPSEDKTKHGCPPPLDRDQDGIVDVDDACPDEKGEPNDDKTKHGCPPPKDTDGDGITDDVDACPKDKGQSNPDPKKNGCPEIRVEEKQIVVLGRVEFETGSAVLRPESTPVLEQVLNVLKEHTVITKLSVEGHTDDRGADVMNKTLSQQRAAAVVRWLTGKGIAANRLTSQGFGEAAPIDTNSTDEGRQNNRRVEFKILERDGKPVDGASSREQGKP